MERFLNFEAPLLENWNQQSQKDKFLLKLKLRQIINQISGNNLAEMLTSVLTSEEKQSINKDVFRAMRNFSRLSNSMKQKERFNYIRCLKEAGLSLDFSKNLGFKASKHLWSTCIRTEPRNKGGRPKIKVEVQKFIDEHLENSSSVASNRTIKDNSGEKISARYCEDTIKEAFKKFYNRILSRELNCEKISFSSFYKYVGKEYKKPHRITDLCDYCEYGKKLRAELKLYAIQNGLNVDESVELDILLRNFEQNRNAHKEAINKINNLKEIVYHKKIANHQRNAYNTMRKDVNLLKDNILIEIDFKQKILIGTSPRQVNSEYYNQELRGLLGKKNFIFSNEFIFCLF